MALVVVAAGLGGYLYLHKSKPGGGITASPETPKFNFQITFYHGLPTSEKKRNAANAEAQKVAPQIACTMDLFYKAAFLDPLNWRSGDYSHVYNLMNPAAVTTAKTQADVLTLGPSAGSAYSKVLPTPQGGTLQTRIIFDSKGKPMTAVAIVQFAANATQKSGGAHKVSSTGSYFLEPIAPPAGASPAASPSAAVTTGASPAASKGPASCTSSAWRVFAYSITRPDLQTSASSTPGASGSPSP